MVTPPPVHAAAFAAALAPLAAPAVAAQAGCSLALAVLFAWLVRRRGTTRRPPLRHWARGWAGLTLSLASLLAWAAWDKRGFWALYLVAGWYFLVELAAGCHELARGTKAAGARRRSVNALLLPGVPAAAMLAGTLVPFFTDLGVMAGFQAAVFASGSGVALALLRSPAGKPAPSQHGERSRRLLRAALVWMAIESTLGALMLIAGALAGPAPAQPASAWGIGAAAWPAWLPAADLCAQIALAAAMTLALCAGPPAGTASPDATAGAVPAAPGA